MQYLPGAASDAMQRTTIPALSGDDAHAVVSVWRVAGLPEEEAAAPILQRPWAGPPELAGDRPS